MERHFADRLTEAINANNAPVCVGLDPVIERFPPSVLDEFNISSKPDEGRVEPKRLVDAILAFGRGVIESVAGFVPAIKINIAFFEPFHAAGTEAYDRLVCDAHSAGLIVIGDIKRADIGHSTARYAEAHLVTPTSRLARDSAVADAVTVNPYFGREGVGPFVDQARQWGRGLFVLVQTSNESAAEVQGLVLADGRTVCHEVARLVNEWGVDESLIGECGYSCVGAVVSPRDLESTRRIRTLMPRSLFLVPGFGAQGRNADEVAACFKSDGSGAIVNASRSVIYAYDQPRFGGPGSRDWKGCITSACREFVALIRPICAP